MRLTWDDAGSRLFEAGVDRGVFYPATGPGVPWNGLTSVREKVDNQGTLVRYVDGQKMANQLQLGTFAADIFALTYPDEMLPYDGYAELMAGQKRKLFNLSYRSLIGNDIKDLSYGYRLHLIFNCLLTPSVRSNETLNADMDTMQFEWQLSTVPVTTPYSRPSAHFFMDSTRVEPAALAAVEEILYGQETGVDPSFPTVQQLMDIFEANAIFTVVDNGDGTVTISGPDDWVYDVGSDQVYVGSPSFTQIDDIRLLARSY